MHGTFFYPSSKHVVNMYIDESACTFSDDLFILNVFRYGELHITTCGIHVVRISQLIFVPDQERKIDVTRTKNGQRIYYLHISY